MLSQQEPSKQIEQLNREKQELVAMASEVISQNQLLLEQIKSLLL